LGRLREQVPAQAEVERQGRVDLPVVLPEEGYLLVGEEGRRARVAAADEGRVVAEEHVGRAGAGVLRPDGDAAEVAREEAAGPGAVLVLPLDGARAPAVQVAVLADADVAAELEGARAANPRQAVGEAPVVRGEVEG